MSKEMKMVDLQNSERSKLVAWDEKQAKQEGYTFFGDTLTGVFKNKREDVGAKNGVIYEMMTEEHGLLGFWGTTVLNDQMSSAKVGHLIIVKFIGLQDTKDGKNSYRNVNVQMSAEPVMEDLAPPMPKM